MLDIVASRVPNGLLWSSKAHNRNYQIATMDVESYSCSQNFFWRWRLFALMEKISKQYSYISPKKRTPRWFVEKYLAGYACPPEDKHRRLICDDEDTDVDETGMTLTPRHLLKPHMSEILGLFAAQAEWFITNNEVRRKQLFDISSWEKFAKEVRKQRKEAARQEVSWGWPEGGEVEEESSEEDDGSEDDLAKLVRENPVIGKSNKIVARKIQLARARSDRGTGLRLSSDSESEGDAPGRAVYVSDFSEPSDAENDSDHWLAEEEAVGQIPWQLQLPPLLPDVDGRWWCPLQECNHQIDLFDLTEEQGRGVPGQLVEYIQQKQWRNVAYDQKVLEGFGFMVRNHYFKHFEERGVRIEKVEGKASHCLRFLENTP
ncbi:hypothetical protein J3R82DRAFT_9641 [Butyriboletus roseoflavus]|nr:hypothetical protein J3R82DRAFT_9641 [Butyriboletus roseoflavus]